jgi:spore maturation protein CgeB
VKLTIFGLTLSSSWGNGHATPYRAIIRALDRLGHRVVFYEKDVPYYAARRDFSDTDYCDLVLYPDWETVRYRALMDVAESDVVITASYVPDGVRINDEVLGLPGPLHVFYDLDTPITLGKLRAAGTDYVNAKQLSEFDLVLSFVGGGILDQLKTEFGVREALPIYGCVDPDTHKRVAARDAYSCLMSYMGTYAADRQQKLNDLFLEPVRRMQEEKFLLAGSLYPWDWRWPENVHRFEHIKPGNHAALYSSSKTTLNITRAEMAQYGWCPSGRFFEAAACGTPVITDTWEGLEDFFTPGEEIFTVECSEDVMRTLQHAPEELGRLAEKARLRTLDEHTVMARARAMLAAFEAVQRPTAEAAQEAA